MKRRKTTLRLGTRGSRLARTQSLWVAEQLMQKNQNLEIELVICTTTGDKVQNKPLYDFGGKGCFTKELEEWILDGRIDFAVHSFKDVPVTMPLTDVSQLCIAAIPKREDPRDVIAAKTRTTLEELPYGAKVGTGSLRRKCQLLAIRPDLDVRMIRGNIDTRLEKLNRGEFDAIVLALAGVRRCGLYDRERMCSIPVSQMLPAAAQGALALQCRDNDDRAKHILASLHDPVTALCVDIEREIIEFLNGDCHSPIAALVKADAETLDVRAVVGSHGGSLPIVSAECTVNCCRPILAIDEITRRLDAVHAKDLLHTPAPRTERISA